MAIKSLVVLQMLVLIIIGYMLVSLPKQEQRKARAELAMVKIFLGLFAVSFAQNVDKAFGTSNSATLAWLLVFAGFAYMAVAFHSLWRDGSKGGRSDK